MKNYKIKIETSLESKRTDKKKVEKKTLDPTHEPLYSTRTTNNRAERWFGKTIMNWKCPPQKAILMWCISASFIIMQFFLQLSMGVIARDLRIDLQIDAFGLSILSSSYYIIYVAMQTPAGAFVDHFGVRRLLRGGAVIVLLGCTLFTYSSTLYQAVLARVLMGAGLAFAFVSTIHIARTWFPRSQQNLMIGIAETVAMFGILMGSVFLSAMMNYINWRRFYMFFNGIVIIGAILAHFFIIEEESEPKEKTLRALLKKTAMNLRIIVQERQVWIMGTYIGLLFAIPTTFAALWGIPFLMRAYQFSTQQATLVVSALYAGIAVGAPLLTWIFADHPHRRIFLTLSPLILTILLSVMISLIIRSTTWLCITMFCIGFINGGFMIGFSMVGELFDKRFKSTATGFANTIAVALTPIASVTVGTLLDLQSQTVSEHNIEFYSASQYQVALSLIPLCTTLAIYVGWKTPKNSISTS